MKTLINPQFVDENEIVNKRISGVSTSVITALIIAMLVLLHFNIDPPKPEEEGGVAVSLGEPDAGGPEEVPVEAYQPPTEPVFQPREEATEQTADPDAVPMPETEKVKKTETPKDPVPQESEMIRKMREAKANQGKPANSGDGDKKGAQGAHDGVPGGDPKGKGGDGDGPNKGIGNGTSPSGTTHTFNGRKMYEPANNENCGAKGTVIVDVTLSANGTVTLAEINTGTKSSNTCLQSLALRLAKKTKFAASTDNKTAEGTITFKFTF